MADYRGILIVITVVGLVGALAYVAFCTDILSGWLGNEEAAIPPGAEESPTVAGVVLYADSKVNYTRVVNSSYVLGMENNYDAAFNLSYNNLSTLQANFTNDNITAIVVNGTMQIRINTQQDNCTLTVRQYNGSAWKNVCTRNITNTTLLSGNTSNYTWYVVPRKVSFDSLLEVRFTYDSNVSTPVLVDAIRVLT